MLTSGFHHIRVHAPGATESATVGNNFSCMICSYPLKEDVKFRVLGGESDASEWWTSPEISEEVKRKLYTGVICMFADKQLVELIHVKALDGLSAYQQSSLRYQSVTLFLRGRSTSSLQNVWALYRSNTGPLYNCAPYTQTTN